MDEDIVKVSVTTKHIMRGVRASSEACPIALALKSKWKSHPVRVLSENILIEGYLFTVDDYLSDWIDTYDQNDQNLSPQEPIDLEVDFAVFEVRGKPAETAA